jgi:hypothetical protein
MPSYIEMLSAVLRKYGRSSKEYKLFKEYCVQYQERKTAMFKIYRTLMLK